MNESFPSTTLAEYAHITMGQSPGSETYNEDEKGLPFLQGCADFGSQHPTPSVYCSPPLRIGKSGSVLISVRAPVGTMNLADQDYCIGRGLGAIEGKPGTADTYFLRYAIESGAGFLHRRSQGSTFLAIGSEDLKKLPLPRINLSVQRAISDVLTIVDHTIEKTESLITKYQQIKAGLMHDLFTRGVTADGKLRPPREQTPELYQETSIGWIPREWDALQLDQISKIIDPQPDHRTPPEQQDGIPYVGIGDFDTFGEIDESACRKIVVSAYMRQASRFNTEEGDIIYGKIGTIGQPKKLPDGSYALSANVLLIKPDINKSFIYHALSTSYFEKQIVNITNTTSQPALGIERFRKLLVSLPQGDEQHMIASQLDAVDAKLSSESSLAQKLKMKKAGLMHDLLTGEVRIKPNKVGKEVVNE
jgi:type I restriction enzyme S subunit